MTTTRKQGARRFDPIAALLEFAADDEQTPDEAEKELREMGVDVDGVLLRVRARIAAKVDL